MQPSAFKRKSVVEIYIYVVPQKAKPEHILKGPVRYKKTTSSGWIEFKFAHIVHHWIKHPAGNRGVVIQALDEDGNNYIVIPETKADDTLVSIYLTYLLNSIHSYQSADLIYKKSVRYVLSIADSILERSEIILLQLLSDVV